MEQSRALPSEQRMSKTRHAPPLVQAIEAQSVFDGVGRGGDENCRALGQVAFDSVVQRQSRGVTPSSPDSATPHYFKP